MFATTISGPNPRVNYIWLCRTLGDGAFEGYTGIIPTEEMQSSDPAWFNRWLNQNVEGDPPPHDECDFIVQLGVGALSDANRVGTARLISWVPVACIQT